MTKSFTDNSGRTWSVVVNCLTLQAVEAAVGVNLGDLRRIDELLDRLRADDLFVGRVAAALCGEQIRRDEVKADDFLRAMAGDPIGAAADAIREGVASFFRNPPTRAAVTKLIEIDRARQEAAVAKIAALSTSGATATNSPASPAASTPAGSPSAS